MICADIIESLPQNVYISFDIDGLDPKLCANTGTPVNGGFEVEHINIGTKVSRTDRVVQLPVPV